MSEHVDRYAVVREPDGRYTVIDKQNENRWKCEPTTRTAARSLAAKLERER